MHHLFICPKIRLIRLAPGYSICISRIGRPHTFYLHAEIIASREDAQVLAVWSKFLLALICVFNCLVHFVAGNLTIVFFFTLRYHKVIEI